MVRKKSAVKVGVCICPSVEDDNDGGDHQSCDIVTFKENEVKISMGAGRGQKSYEIDFEVC